MFAASKTASVSGGYQISRSLRFNSADSANLSRTPATATNQQTWTWSGWFKRSSLSTLQVIFYQNTAPTDTGFFEFYFNTSDQMVLAGGFTTWRATTQVFRDVSAWMHMVVAVDTTQATANNRVRLYINGSEVTTFSTTNNPAQNANTGVNGTGLMGIGRDNSGLYFNGYQTECYLIDGQQLTPSSFGETNAQTGVWQPKAFSGTYGTNGFYLNFSDNSNTTAATLGKDYSGNGNNWTPNNFSVTAGSGNDSLVDSPTNYGSDTGLGGTVRGNYATLNAVSTAITLSNGNLAFTSGATNTSSYSTIGMSSGKWYAEVTWSTAGSTSILGVALQGYADISTFPGNQLYSYGYDKDGKKYNNNTGVAYGATFTSGDIISIALDVDAGTITYYKNGSTQGTAFTSLPAGTYFIGVGLSSSTGDINFGQRPFAYTAPSGFKALCTQNLPTPTIGANGIQAGKFFNPVLYTGNGTGQSITGVGFQPDFTWIKSRSNALSNGLYDAVRGVQKQLISNSTSAETTETTGLTSFDSDGFTTGLLLQLNTITATYVAWNWKANGAGSSNTAGSITSTVSANTTSGFSIVTYASNNTAGATIGHGLGVAPSMVICRERNTGASWAVYHSALGNTKYILLNSNNAAVTSSQEFNSTAPTSTVVTLGGAGSNTNDGTGVLGLAYCFAPIAGYSAFGSYIGNSSTDGPFVYTGFRPAYVMIKTTAATDGWTIQDSTRFPTNVITDILAANNSGSEATFTSVFNIDFLSNGFKIRNTQSAQNTSGTTYIYMVFASNPFKYSLAR